MSAPLEALKTLLKAELSPEDYELFEEADFHLLLLKRFKNKYALQRATRSDLQGPPGEALGPLLIRAILQKFNPSALEPPGTVSF